jgi:hypothetical protein
VRTAILLLLLPATLALGSDRKEWQHEQREIDREAKKFWDEFAGRFNDALARFREPVQQAWENPEQHKEAVYDYAPLDRLYAEAREFGARRGRADAQLDLQDKKACAALFKDLLEAAKRADAMEEKLADPNPDFGRYTYDQESGCRIEAFEARLALAVPALGRAQLEFLTQDAWKKCARADARRSTRRRTMLLDALAARADPAALDFLKNCLADKSRAVRVAAVEAMVACGAETRPLLADEDAVLRRALLLAWLENPKPEWFGAILEHASRARGFEGDLCVRLLSRISNQKFGHDLAAWRTWFGEYKGEIEGGKFDVKNIEVVEAKPAPGSDGFVFYGLRVPSIGAFFAIDASDHIAMPADVDVQRTRWRGEWRGTRRKWEADHVAHQTVVSREFTSAFGTFPKDFHWGMVTLFGRFATKAVGDKRLAGTRPGDLREGLKLIEQAPQKGWCSPLAGLLIAADLGGDGIDTVVLWHTGDPSGGRYVNAGAAAAAWRRENRARKLQVVAIRISNRKDPAETFMKAVAEQSGGPYLWANKPPASGG